MKTYITLGELATILEGRAKSYRNGLLIKKIVPKLKNKFISKKIVRQILEPFIRDAGRHLPVEVRRRLERDFENYVPLALEKILRNSHMHKGRGHLLTQNNADALLVIFINEACRPMDLGLYTHYLLPKD